MNGDGSFTRFYDSVGENPFYASLLVHSLFSRQNIPTCEGTCIASANLGSCAATDTACLCKSDTFISSVAACVEKTCTGSDLSTAITATEQLCIAVGTPASISSSTSSKSANGRSTVMIGPIVAGVVGFLALVVFVLGLVWYFKFHRKRGVWVRRFPSEFSLTSAGHSPVLPSSPIEPFPIPSAAPQNSGQLQSSSTPTSSGRPLASPSMKQVEAVRLIPTTTQTPSTMQMSSPSADTPIGGLYSHAMLGNTSRVLLHEDSGFRLPREAGENEVVVEMPPLYTPS